MLTKSGYMKKILLIEDNDDVRSNTAELLELANYHVVLAENGKAGVLKAIEHHPDLIICDIMMPELDGYGVLHALHKNNSLKCIPFIFLTAKSERSDVRKGMELGADDYITKPFTGTELLNAVDCRINTHKCPISEKEADMPDQQILTTEDQYDDVLSNFTSGRHVNKFKKKQVIYSEGNHPTRLYFIIKGKVKAFKTHEDGKELVTELYKPGDFLGYVALLEKKPYKDTAEALEETELAVIPREDFDEIIMTSPSVARKFIQLLANDVSEKEEHLLGLAYNSLRKKVAEALLFLQEKFHQSQGNPFTINISRENLATIAGTATESLIRTLSDFREEKLIDIKEGKIIVLNNQGLKNLIN